MPGGGAKRGNGAPREVAPEARSDDRRDAVGRPRRDRVVLMSVGSGLLLKVLDGQSRLLVARQEFRPRLIARLGQQLVRLGPAFDGARFHAVGTMADTAVHQVL